MPPPTRLRTNSPIVPTNQTAATGQRWRELHIAIRTVAGSRILVIGSGLAIVLTWSHDISQAGAGARPRGPAYQPGVNNAPAAWRRYEDPEPVVLSRRRSRRSTV